MSDSIGDMAKSALFNFALARSSVFVYRAIEEVSAGSTMSTNLIHNETTAAPIWQGDIAIEPLRQNEPGRKFEDYGTEDVDIMNSVFPPECPALKKSDLIIEYAVNGSEVPYASQRRFFLDKDLPRGLDREARLKEEGTR